MKALEGRNDGDARFLPVRRTAYVGCEDREEELEDFRYEVGM